MQNSKAYLVTTEKEVFTDPVPTASALGTLDTLIQVWMPSTSSPVLQGDRTDKATLAEFPSSGLTLAHSAVTSEHFYMAALNQALLRDFSLRSF